MADRKEDNDSLLTNLAEAYMALKSVKLVTKFFVAPLAISAAGFYLYRRIRGKLLTA